MVGQSPNKMAENFSCWLADALPRLTRWNSQDVHINQLGNIPNGAASVDLAMTLFNWADSNLGHVLSNKLLMLLFPLQSSTNIDLDVPKWSAINLQLSTRPPSIYVMNACAFLQEDRQLQYSASVNVPISAQHIRATYSCWRHIDDPKEEEWCRDIRILSSVHLVS